jgi:hypothetical protein
MSTRPFSVPRLLAAIALGACASGGNSAGKSAGTAAPPSRSMTAPSRANVLTSEEIQRTHLSTVYDVVSALRPRWLQTRGTDSFQHPSEIQVYVGNTRVNGGVAYLRDISALGITRIEFIDGITASARWGLDHGAGAIVVSMAERDR